MGILSKFVDGGVGGTSKNVLSTLLEAGVRFFQFVFGIAVIGLYGQDVRDANKHNADMDNRWVYAVAISSISSITALIYLILPFVLPHPPRLMKAIHLPTFVYDILLWILWLVVFGIFAKLFLPLDPKEFKDGAKDDIQRMRRAVYVDLVNMLLWSLSVIGLGIRWFKGRKDGDGGESGSAEMGFKGEGAYEVREV